MSQSKVVAELVNVHTEIVTVGHPRATQLIAADIAETIPLAQLMKRINMRYTGSDETYR